MKDALLNKVKAKVERVVSRIAYLFVKAGISPNTLTFSSLILSTAGYLVVLYTRSGLNLALIILLSGFLDAIDGAVARASGSASRRGAFLDSFIDRVCEIIYGLSFIELGFNPILVLLFTGSSLLVSYTRSRGESLGVQLMGVGLMERAERLVALALSSLIYYYEPIIATYLYTAATILVVITVIHRFNHIWVHLG